MTHVCRDQSRGKLNPKKISRYAPEAHHDEKQNIEAISTACEPIFALFDVLNSTINISDQHVKEDDRKKEIVAQCLFKISVDER